MSSFNNPHYIFLFEMKNGKEKLAYGPTPQDAYESLRLRLSTQEMELIYPDKYTRIPQRELQQHVHNLG
ncbi:MAG: hypothetical protein BroJett039_01140 [Chloroflexota bacterium]|nr:MAG: hypothetical protein BroJett039_01140 [Chloroflexota bacterium]